MKTPNAIALALTLVLGFSSVIAADPHAPSQTQTHHVKKVVHHQMPTKHAAAQERHVVKTHPSSAMSHHVARPQAEAKERTRTRQAVRESTSSQHVVVFVRHSRVAGSVIAFSGNRAVVRLPNGATRRFFVLRETTDRDRLVFSNAGVTRTFIVNRVSRPINHQIVVFANEVELEREPEVTVLRTIEREDEGLMLAEPRQVLAPVVVRTIEPLPSGRVALFAEDELPQSFVQPNVTFVGRVIGVAGNLVTFLLPDGTTRTLVDSGPMPSVGSQVVVIENGQQVLSLSPAVTNFVGQVVSSFDNNLVTFALPDGTVRTLTVVQPVPVPVPGARVVVFENGQEVQRIQLL